MSRRGLDGAFGGLTVEKFAALPAAWPEYFLLEEGLLIARIHPRNNRPSGDEDVLARALAYVPGKGVEEPEVHQFLNDISPPDLRTAEPGVDLGGLHRVTVRVEQIMPRPASKNDSVGWMGKEYNDLYRDLLCWIFQLPVIELPTEAQVHAKLQPFVMAADHPAL